MLRGFIKNTIEILRTDLAENADLNLHRLLMVISSVFIPIYVFVLHYLGINYPMMIAWIISALILIFFISTFIFKEVRENITPYQLVLYYLVTLWIIHLNHYAYYSVDTVIAVLVVCFCVSLLIKDNQHLMWYIIVAMVTVIASSIVIDDPVVNRATMSMGIVLFGLVAYMLLSSKNENEEILRKRETELSLAIRQIPALLWTTDDKLRFVSLLGLSIESMKIKTQEIIGKTMYDFFKMHHHHITPIHQHLRALRGESNDFEFEWGDICFHCHVEPLRDNYGKIIGTIGIGQDITERKKTEQVLQKQETIKESERFFRNAMENMPFIALGVNEQGDINFANKYFLNLTGYTSEEVIGSNWFDKFVPAHEIARRKNYLKEFFSFPPDTLNEIFPYNQNTVLTKIGKLLHINWGYSFTYDADGKKISLNSIGEDITEKKKSDEILKLSDNILKRVANLVIVADKEGQIQYVSPSSKKILGFEPHELLGNGWWEKTHADPSFREQDMEYIKKISRKEIPDYDRPYENFSFTKSGEKHWMRWQDSVTEDGMVIGVAYDITDEKNAELKLKQTSEKLQSFFDNAYDLIQSVDEQGKYLYVNEAWKQTLEYTDEEAKKITFNQIIHQDYLSHCVTVFSKLLKGENIREFEVAFLSKSGKKIELIGSMMAHFENGQFLSTMGIFKDITNRKKIERQLTQSEEKYRTLIETMSEGVLYVDNNDVIQFVNKPFLEMTGYTENDLIGKIGNQIFIDSEKMREFILDQNKQRKLGKSNQYEILFKKKNGEKIWLLINGVPVYDSNGKVIGSLGTHLDINEKKLAENNLKISEEKWRSLVENAPDIILHISLDAEILFINTPSYKQVIGKSAYEFIPEEQHNILKESLEKVKTTGQPNTYELEGYKTDGTIGWYFTRVSGIYHEDKLASFAMITSEITERKKIESQIKESEVRFRQLIEAAPDAVITINEEGLIANWNLQAEKMFGWKENEIIGLKLTNTIIPERYWKQHEIGMEHFLKSGEGPALNRPIEIYACTKDKYEFPIELKISASKISDKYVFVGFIRDITERKRVESQIKESEEKFRGIFESIQDIYCRTDKNSVIQIISPSVQDVLGFSPEELIGKNIAEIYVNPPDMEKLISDLREFRKSTNFEAAFKTKDGKEIIISTNANYIYDTDGNIIGTEGVGRNITKQKMTEREMARAKKLAEESSKAKTEFVANISHEIRTPMNGIIGMVDLLMESGLNYEQRDFAKTIQESSQTLLHLINDILDFSALETHKVKIKPEPCNLILLLEKTVSSYEREAKNNNISIGYDIISSVPKLVLIDEFRVKQLLNNLIANAFKFTNEGRIFIRVSQIGQKQKARLKFEVMDTGIGIAREDKNKLFRKFSQIDSSLNKKYRGTGLGLVICNQLVKLMGGEMDFNSEPGQGSSFWFTLKFTSQKENSLLENLKILLVSDEEKDLKTFSSMFHKWKISHTIMTWKKMKIKEKFHLAIVDSKKPVSDYLAKIELLVPEIIISDRIKIKSKKIFHSVSLTASPLEMMEVIINSFITNEEKITTTENVHFEKAKILLIEDDIVNRKVIGKMLNKAGIEVTIAVNGIEGFDLAVKNNYDLILTDYHLPDKSGLSIVEDLKKIKNKKTPPIIVLTANAMEEHKEKFITSGVADYLVKPVNFSSIVKAISKWVSVSEKINLKSDGKDKEKTKNNDDEMLNHSLILHLKSMFGEEFQQLINDYRQQAEKLISTSYAAFEKNDLSTASSELHILKGTSSALGIKKIADLAARTEQMLIENKIDLARTEFDHLQKNFTLLKKLLPQYFKESLISG